MIIGIISNGKMERGIFLHSIAKHPFPSPRYEYYSQSQIYFFHPIPQFKSQIPYFSQKNKSPSISPNIRIDININPRVHTQPRILDIITLCIITPERHNGTIPPPPTIISGCLSLDEGCVL